MQLFNGKTLQGWAATGNADGWTVADNCIFCKAEKGGYLYYNQEQFKNFELSLEFKHEAKANSGVFFRWTDLNDPVQTGIEIQIYDTYGRQPATTHCCGAVYDLQAPTHNACKPAGEWNTMILYTKDNIIRITLNGEQIVDMDLNRWTTAGQNPDGSPNKFKRAYNTMTETGYLGLQDHGGKLWFRNLNIEKL
jgi:hypothetical protein